MASLSRLRQNLRYENRVREGILNDFQSAASDQSIGVGVYAGRSGSDAHVRSEHSALLLQQSVTQFAQKIGTDKRVVDCAARHGKHSPVDIFAAKLGRIFQPDVFTDGQ